MSQNLAVMPPVPAELRITILNGPDKGAVFKVISAKVTIGRAHGNDIVLKDPRASRQHATITIQQNGIEIEDLGSQNGIEVDGIQTRKSPLKNKSQVVVGGTLFRFEIVQPGLSVQVPNSPVGTTSNASVPASFGPMTFKSNAKNKKIQFYAIVGIVLLALVYILSQPNLIKKNSLALKTNSSVEEELKAARERQEAIIKSQTTRGVGTKEYTDLQGLYLQGFRDYREGNYQRAISAFEAVLAINPSHALATRYRQLSRLQMDEQIQLLMLQGKRYLEQSKYQLAMDSYRQVLILVEDQNSQIYKEAKTLFEECQLLLKGAY